jgi:hypothetical protein
MSQMKIPDTVIANPKADYTAAKQLKAFTSQSLGAFRVINQLQQVIKTLNQFLTKAGSRPVLKEFESTLGVGKSVLAIPYIPGVTDAAVQAWEDLKAKDGQAPAHFEKKAAVAVRQTSEMASVWLFAANLPLRSMMPLLSTPITTVATVFGTLEDTTDIGIRAYDVKKCIEMDVLAEQSMNNPRVEKRATNEVKQAISDTKTHAMMRLAKAVCASVGGILGLAMMATGVALIPGIALAILSLGAASFAIGSDFYKESRSFNLISI